MASRGRVYLETTVISYLAARLSRDLRVAAHQQVTSDWWAARRVDFEVFVSQLVVEEASAGDRDAAARRLAYLEDIHIVDLNEASLSLAEKLLADGAVPVGSEQGALHIALAAVQRYDVLAHPELQAHRQRGHAKPHHGNVLECRLRRAGDLHARRTSRGVAHVER